MFGTFQNWRSSLRISDAPFQPACPPTPTYTCKHMLICLAGCSSLCGTPKLLGPQLAPESPLYAVHMIDITADITWKTPDVLAGPYVPPFDC